MAKLIDKKKFLDKTVVEAAYERAKHIWTASDEVLVSFSGGKDSLVTMYILEDVRKQLGIERKMNVVFYDQELASDTQIDYIKEIYESGVYNFMWVCFPLKSERFILGKKLPYVQWDITREFVREPPEYAHTFFECQPTKEGILVDTEIIPRFWPNKKVSNCLGLRADESANRAKAVFNTTSGFPYIVEANNSTWTTKIIYDWTTKDIFKFIHDKKIPYCPEYEAKMWANNTLRIATPITNEASKKLNELKQQDPIFYDRLVTVFPEMIIQAEYYKFYDKAKVYEKYGVTPEGIINWMQDNLNGKDKEMAFQKFAHCMTRREEDAREGRFPSQFPLYWIFYSMVIGTYKRMITFVHPDVCRNNERMMEPEEAYRDWKLANPEKVKYQ